MTIDNITTIVFDLDDTLRHNEPHANTFFTDYAESITRPFTEEQRRASRRWEHNYWANSADLLGDQASLTADSEAFWLNYSKRHLLSLGFDEADARQHASSVHGHMRANYRPVGHVKPGVTNMLASLRAAGYMLGVLTNRVRAIYGEMHTLGLDFYFDFFLSAGQLGAFKPEIEIFQNLQKFLGRPAQEIMYVGDNYYADIIGAQRAGLFGVLVDPLRLYDDPGCPVIEEITDLEQLLKLEPTR
jgi:FMN phosphatase YigB (HAD superfamily)